MTKYIVFGWSELSDKLGPADELLGTTGEVADDDVEYSKEQLPNGLWNTNFGRKMVWKNITLADNLMKGKTLPMQVMVTWGAEGFESARPILAYYEVPGTDNG